MVKGKVVDGKNNPVGFVTIYCKELKKGTNSNADGTFEINLLEGNYQLVFQSVGYKTISISINSSNANNALNVILEEQAYNLNAVTISANGVNPAIWIMRKAIAAAPYYKRQVLMYTSKVYIKGSGKLDNIPFLFKKTLKKDGFEEGKIFILESINEVSFTQPNTYKEKAISVKTSLPVDGAPKPIEMIRGSMYSTNDNDMVSPLSPQAFSVYDFKLEGSFFEDGREVNKIKVTPKRKGQDVYNGYLYIMEGLWCLHSTDLTNKSSNFTSRIITSFRPVVGFDYVWMPITYDISVNGGFLGFEGSFKYLASVSNYKVRLNPNLNHQWVQQQTKGPTQTPIEQEKLKANKPKTKRQQDIENLLAKGQLSKLEMLKLANKMRKESEAEQLNNLQVDADSSTMEVDSMATKRDSLFWKENRPLALMESEVVSYHQADSMIAKKLKDSLTNDSNKHKKGFDVAAIFTGKTFYFNQKKNYVNWSGIGPGGEIFLNTVDGWGAAVQWKIGNIHKDKKEWAFTHKIRIPFERPVVNSFARLEYNYAPLKKGKVFAEAGTYVSDFNATGGPTNFVNYLLLVFDQRNVLKLYQQDYVKLFHTREITNGLEWKIEAGLYHRYELSNITRYADQETKDGKITSNQPILGYHMPNNNAAIVNNTFTYTPRQRYRILGGQKNYIQGKLPTFQLGFTNGIPSLLGSDVNFGKLDISVTERLPLRHWLAVKAKIAHGFFLYNTQSYFPDYSQFNGNRSPVFNGDPLYMFRQLDYYSYATTHSYTTLHGEFDFKRLVIKRLPFINMTRIREVLFYNGLLVQSQSSYQELGYGLEGFGGLIRADVFAGFKGSNYDNWGLRLILNFKELQ